MFAYVYFRCERDSTIQRGFLQKSVVVISRFPFIKLFMDTISHVGTCYFERQNSFSFDKILNDINKWPSPQLDFQYNVELFGKKISYKSPAYLPRNVKCKFVRHKRTTNAQQNGKSIYY